MRAASSSCHLRVVPSARARRLAAVRMLRAVAAISRRYPEAARLDIEDSHRAFLGGEPSRTAGGAW